MKTIESFIKNCLGIAVLSVITLNGCVEHVPPKEVAKNAPELNLEKAAQLNVSLGLTYLKQNEMTRAKLKLNRAMKLAPQLPEVHYGMAFYFEQVGEVDAARKAYQRSIALNPKGGIEHNNYGTFLCKHHEYRASEKEFLQALTDPNYLNSAEALENAGLCVLEIPDEANATEYFKRALQHDSKRYNALIELAYISYQHKDFQSASMYCAQYELIAEPTARSLWLSIQLATHLEDKNKVSSDRLLLKDRFPNSKEYKDIIEK